MREYTVRVFTRDAKIRETAMRVVKEVCGKCYAKLDNGVLLLTARCEYFDLLRARMADEILMSACFIY